MPGPNVTEEMRRELARTVQNEIESWSQREGFAIQGIDIDIDLQGRAAITVCLVSPTFGRLELSESATRSFLSGNRDALSDVCDSLRNQFDEEIFPPVGPRTGVVIQLKDSPDRIVLRLFWQSDVEGGNITRVDQNGKIVWRSDAPPTTAARDAWIAMNLVGTGLNVTSHSGDTFVLDPDTGRLKSSDGSTEQSP